MFGNAYTFRILNLSILSMTIGSSTLTLPMIVALVC